MRTMSKLAKVTMSEKSTVMEMMLRIIGSVVPDLLPPVGAVDLGGFIQLLRHGLERREVHDQEKWRAVPDVHQDHREARPVRVAQPGDARQADAREDPVERGIGRVEEPEPGERVPGRRAHRGTEKNAA